MLCKGRLSGWWRRGYFHSTIADKESFAWGLSHEESNNNRILSRCFLERKAIKSPVLSSRENEFLCLNEIRCEQLVVVDPACDNIPLIALTIPYD